MSRACIFWILALASLALASPHGYGPAPYHPAPHGHVCSSFPYAAFLPLSKYPKALSLCSAKFPVHGYVSTSYTTSIKTLVKTCSENTATTTTTTETSVTTSTIPSLVGTTTTTTAFSTSTSTTTTTTSTVSTVPYIAKRGKNTEPTLKPLASLFSSLEKKAGNILSTACSCIENPAPGVTVVTVLTTKTTTTKKISTSTKTALRTTTTTATTLVPTTSVSTTITTEPTLTTTTTTTTTTSTTTSNPCSAGYTPAPAAGTCGCTYCIGDISNSGNEQTGFAFTDTAPECETACDNILGDSCLAWYFAPSLDLEDFPSACFMYNYFPGIQSPGSGGEEAGYRVSCPAGNGCSAS